MSKAPSSMMGMNSIPSLGRATAAVSVIAEIPGTMARCVSAQRSADLQIRTRWADERTPCRSAAGRRPGRCIGMLGSTISKAPQERIIEFLRCEPPQLFLQCHPLDLRGDLF